MWKLACVCKLNYILLRMDSACIFLKNKEDSSMQHTIKSRFKEVSDLSNAVAQSIDIEKNNFLFFSEVCFYEFWNPSENWRNSYLNVQQEIGLKSWSLPQKNRRVGSSVILLFSDTYKTHTFTKRKTILTQVSQTFLWNHQDECICID